MENPPVFDCAYHQNEVTLPSQHPEECRGQILCKLLRQYLAQGSSFLLRFTFKCRYPRAVLCYVVAAHYMWLFKCQLRVIKLNYQKFHFPVAFATFQVPSSYLWLMAMALDSTGICISTRSSAGQHSARVRRTSSRFLSWGSPRSGATWDGLIGTGFLLCIWLLV